jgi:NAD(P)H-nitrite reductase large subunit
MGTPFKLKNGSVALMAEVPGGLYNSAHLKKLATISEQHSVIMKATEDQRIVMFVVPEQVESISRELISGGLAVRDYQDGIHQPVACVGALCPESKQDALKASLDITEALAGIEAVAALKIGINGCAACCVPCHTLDIAIVGQEEGYRISLGGKQMIVPELASFAAEGVPAGELVDKVRAIVDTWKEHGQPG